MHLLFKGIFHSYIGKIHPTRTYIALSAKPYLPKKSLSFCVFGFVFLYPVRMDDQMFLKLKSSPARGQLHSRVAKTLLSMKATLANQLGFFACFRSYHKEI
jgi:hypothetical protein